MQKIISLKIIMSLFAVLLTLSLIACASTRDSNRVEMKKLLTAAGFKMAVADTPGEAGRVERKLPQREIVPREDGDTLIYIYADAENCKCAYAGDEEAFKKYQKLIPCESRSPTKTAVILSEISKGRGTRMTPVLAETGSIFQMNNEN